MRKISKMQEMAIISLYEAKQEEDISGYRASTWNSLTKKGLVRWDGIGCNLGYYLTSAGEKMHKEISE